jgi:hypothetical protein
MHEALQLFIAKEKPPFGTSKLASWMRTAFAAEMTKEKARLDGLAKIGKPPSMPPPHPSVGISSSRSIEELPEESTTISASPFDMSTEGARPSSAEDEIHGDATQIFFSADDNVDEEEPTTAMVGSARSANQETASLMAASEMDARTHARISAPPPPAPTFASVGSQGDVNKEKDKMATPAGIPTAESPSAFVPPPPAPQNEVAQKTVVKAPEPVVRSRVAAQDTIEILPTARRRRSRRWLGVGLAIAAFSTMALIVGLAIFLGRSSGGTIEIRIAPADAVTTVLIDGTPRGRAPLRVENVPAGAHLIEIQAPGYQSVTQTVPVTDGAMAMLVIPLIPAVAGVPVPRVVPSSPGAAAGGAAVNPVAEATQPDTAAAVVGTAQPDTAAAVPSNPSSSAETSSATPEAGTQPTSAQAQTDSQTAIASTDAQDEITSPDRTVRRTPVRGRRPSVRRATVATRPETESASRGYLMIQTLPWARVFIDGRDTGQNTPVRQMAVPAGSHRIGLRTSDGQMHTITVDVPAGETVRVVRQL